MRLSKFKSELKAFYKEDLTVQQLIDTKFQSKISLQEDIIEIAKAVNGA